MKLFLLLYISQLYYILICNVPVFGEYLKGYRHQKSLWSDIFILLLQGIKNRDWVNTDAFMFDVIETDNVYLWYVERFTISEYLTQTSGSGFTLRTITYWFCMNVYNWTELILAAQCLRCFLHRFLDGWEDFSLFLWFVYNIWQCESQK